MQAEDSTSETKTKWSDENIIELIRRTRDDLVKNLFDDQNLKTYLKEQHQMNDVSAIKLEFLKRTLNELLVSSIDLVHYGQLILAKRKSDTTSFTEADKALFIQEIEKAIKNYID